MAVRDESARKAKRPPPKRKTTDLDVLIETPERDSSKGNYEARRADPKDAADHERQRPIEAGVRLSYEASPEERALDVDDQAEALAAALDSADGEVCFALLGHWGRGKTFLVRRLQALLPTFRWRKHTYEVVWLSAWRYPDVPKIWVHLYESLARKAYGGPWWIWVPRAVRANLARHGVWPLALELLIAAGLMVPLWMGFELFQAAIGFIGAIGLITVAKSARSVLRPAKRIRSRYIERPDHTDKLGVQAAIGKDLQGLLAGWLRWKHPRYWQLSIAGVVIVLGCIAPATALAGGIWDVSHNVAIAVGGSWLLFSVACASWFAFAGRGPERVLLVVDDLDRCDAESICDIVEALKLSVEDEDFQKRLQALVIVEERALEWALQRRFEGRATGLSPDGTLDRALLQRLVAEHFQKLFVSHMRLPALGEEELKEVLAVYLKHVESEIGGPSDELPHKKRTRGWFAALRRWLRSQNTEHVRPRETRVPRLAPEDLRYEKDERTILEEAASYLERASYATPGPRALRSFLFRYQLARLLVRMRGVRADPAALVNALLGQPSDSPAIQAVVRLVAPHDNALQAAGADGPGATNRPKPANSPVPTGA